MIVLVITVLAVIGTGPWVLYAVALAKIGGRPSHAARAPPAPEDVEALWRNLRIEQPTEIRPLSPYSYIWAFVSGGPRSLEPEARIAWPIAASHNADHLADRSVWWHISGAALLIWLTRNWTMEELIAKDVELENDKAAAKAKKGITR